MNYKTRKEINDRIICLRSIINSYKRYPEDDPIYSMIGKDQIANTISRINEIIIELEKEVDKIPYAFVYEGTLYKRDFLTKQPEPMTGRFFLRNGLTRWKRADGTCLVYAYKNKEMTEHLNQNEATPIFSWKEAEALGARYV